MKYTNTNNIPKEIIRAVSNDSYSKGASTISVTGLLQPPRIRILREEYDDDIVVDVSNEIAIIESLNQAHKSCGRIDGLVNNAPSIHTGKITDLSLSAWKTNFKANLDAVFLATKTVLPWMIEAKQGSIVNIASVVGLKGVAYMSAYGAAKAGLINFSRASAIEAAPHVRVNCLIPGAVLTPATERAIPDESMMQATINSIPLKRIADPIELAKPIAFFLSQDSSFITGASLVVDGGKTADLNAGH